jgi:hypothetical protein
MPGGSELRTFSGMTFGAMGTHKARNVERIACFG